MAKFRTLHCFVFAVLLFYFAASFTFIEWSYQHLISEIERADGHVAMRPPELFGWRTCDRVKSVVLPEAIVQASPEMLVAMRKLKRLESVSIRVTLSESGAGLRQLKAVDGPSLLTKYYEFVHSGRPCRMTISEDIKDDANCVRQY